MTRSVRKTFKIFETRMILLMGSILLMSQIAMSQSETNMPERTCFQTGRGWMPEIDLRSDVAVVYGVNASLSERITGWRERGYGTHLMTGVAWGDYQDYLDGLFDGNQHWDESQTDRDGKPIMHHQGAPYMVPSLTFIEYLKSHIKTAIDAGVTSIFLEEPEFWNHAGYSEAFKREWQSYYGEPWRPQHESPEATFRSAKLKYYLYSRALNELFAFAKSYGESKGRTIGCYAATHSLVNYSSWGIVSPESSLAANENINGYIAQVWTGTARTPNVYRGNVKERTFETAFLEYGQMVSMTLGTPDSQRRSRVYFLTDPIEDNPRYTWENYRGNYEKTFVAQLMWPQTYYYEVMPWPDRIFTGQYATADGGKSRIPSSYATEILTLINALNDMDQNDTVWDCGTRGMGVLVSDSLMFQRYLSHGEEWEDPHHSNFFGLALPLLKQGIPVQPIHLERLEGSSALSSMAVLLLTYTSMKPASPDIHKRLAAWVQGGGCLAYFGSDRDPYQTMPEWWNRDYDYETPSQHLFECLGLPRNPEEGIHQVGQGVVSVSRRDPFKLAADKYGARNVRRAVRGMLEAKGLEGLWKSQHYLHLRRGPYHIISVLDESQNQEDTENGKFKLEGRLIDLFDAALPVVKQKEYEPGQVGFLYDIKHAPAIRPWVIAGAARITDTERADGVYRFEAKGPILTRAVMRVLLDKKPSKIDVQYPQSTGLTEFDAEWDAETSTLKLDFLNQPDGVNITLEW